MVLVQLVPVALDNGDMQTAVQVLVNLYELTGGEKYREFVERLMGGAEGSSRTRSSSLAN